MTTINLNARIRVKLTPRGVDVYDDYWRRALFGSGLTVPPLIDGDIYESELHSFAAVFGPRFGCGYPLTVGTDLTVLSPD